MRFPTNPINALEASLITMAWTLNWAFGFQLIQLTHWKRAPRCGSSFLKLLRFQLIQLTHWKREIASVGLAGVAGFMFPTNPINALEASFSTTTLKGGHTLFPTNPINALEARSGRKLPAKIITSFQLIQLTHWKRAGLQQRHRSRCRFVSN